MELNKDDLKKFSPTEKKILDILTHTKKKLLIAEVADKFYSKNLPKPIDPNSIVSGAILNINKKCAYNKLKWAINGKGLGRNGKTVWIEDKK